MHIDPVSKIAKDARILIVDDEELNVSQLGQVLSRAGYAICISITDPAEALAKFADVQPDLLLLDWHMEPLSGLEFIQELLSLRRRHLAPHLPSMRHGGRFEIVDGVLRVEWELTQDVRWTLIAHFGAHAAYAAVPAAATIFSMGAAAAAPQVRLEPGGVIVTCG